MTCFSVTLPALVILGEFLTLICHPWRVPKHEHKHMYTFARALVKVDGKFQP